MADGRDGKGRFLPGAEHTVKGGRKPSRRRIEPLLQRIGEEITMHDGEPVSKLEAVIRAVYEYAIKGQSWAVQFIAERTEGRVRDYQPVEKDESGPIKILTYDGDQTAPVEAATDSDGEDEADG